MEETLVLIDLANTSLFRGLQHPNPEIVNSRLDGYLNPLLERIHNSIGADGANYRIRIYDGWFDDLGRGSDTYALVKSYVRDKYPTRRKRYRLFAEVADAPLAAKHERFLGTFRDIAGISRNKISVNDRAPSACSSPNTCSLGLLRSWAKGKCPESSCSVETTAIASFRQQKLVDTLLVADAVWAGSQRISTVIVSDDEDVIPGMIVARDFGAPVSWATQSEQPRELYSDLIARHSIEYIPC